MNKVIATLTEMKTDTLCLKETIFLHSQTLYQHLFHVRARIWRTEIRYEQTEIYFIKYTMK